MAVSNIPCPVLEYHVIDTTEEESAETLQAKMNQLAAEGWTMSCVVPPAHIEPGAVTPTLIIMARQSGIRIVAIELGILAAGSILAS